MKTVNSICVTVAFLAVCALVYVGKIDSGQFFELLSTLAGGVGLHMHVMKTRQPIVSPEPPQA